MGLLVSADVEMGDWYQQKRWNPSMSVAQDNLLCLSFAAQHIAAALRTFDPVHMSIW